MALQTMTTTSAPFNVNIANALASWRRDTAKASGRRAGQILPPQAIQNLAKKPAANDFDLLDAGVPALIAARVAGDLLKICGGGTGSQPTGTQPHTAFMAQDEQAGMLSSIQQNAEGQNAEAPAVDEPAEANQPEPEEAPRERDSQVCERFHITDKSGLQWYAKRIAAIRSERETVKAQADKMLTALNADEAILRGLYEAEAQQVTAQILADGGNKRKSVETWHGTFAFCTVPGSYSVTDTEAALPHAHALGCTKTTVAADAYLKVALEKMETTGELLPGVAKSEDRESFGLHLPSKKKKGGIITHEDLPEQTN